MYGSLGESSDARLFDTAFVDTSLDSEGTLVTPGLVPRVNDSPVGSAIFDTPTNHLDGVTTEGLTSVVGVDTALVGEEIFVNGEGDFNGSVGHEFRLDGSGVAGDGVRLGTLVDILSEGGSVGGISIARLGALGGGEFTSAGRVDIGFDVVSAGGEGVRLAPRGGSVEITSDQTSVHVVLHGSQGVTTVATVTAGLAAGEHVLSRQADVLASLDAVSVGDRFDGTESPA